MLRIITILAIYFLSSAFGVFWLELDGEGKRLVQQTIIKFAYNSIRSPATE